MPYRNLGEVLKQSKNGHLFLVVLKSMYSTTAPTVANTTPTHVSTEAQKIDAKAIPLVSYNALLTNESCTEVSRNGLKHSNSTRGPATGLCLMMNKVDIGIVVLDFDTPKNQPTLITRIHEMFDASMADHLSELTAVTTGRNGLHVYLRADPSTEALFKERNSYIGFMTVFGCSVDIFGSHLHEKRIGIMMAGSSVNDDKQLLTRKYSISHGTSERSPITMTITEFVTVFGIVDDYRSAISRLNTPTARAERPSMDGSVDARSHAVDSDIIDILHKHIRVSGKRFTIHGNKSISAFIVCACMNSLLPDVGKRFEEKIMRDDTICTITEHGLSALDRGTDKVLPFEYLLKLIYSEIDSDAKRYITQAINSRVANSFDTHIPEDDIKTLSRIGIDVLDMTITLETVIDDYVHGHVVGFPDCLAALRRVIAFIPDDVRSRVAVKSIIDGRVVIHMAFRSDLIERVRHNVPEGFKGRSLLLRVIDLEENGLLMSKGLRFRTEDTSYISTFTGLPYDGTHSADNLFETVPSGDHILDSLISGHSDMLKPWFDYIREVICDGNAERESFLHAWVSRMLTSRRPEDRPKKALVLFGLFGSGKTTMASILRDVIGEAFSVELTGLDGVSGNFNSIIRDKLLVVCNEISVKDDVQGEERLKTSITDNTIEIREKYQPSIVCDNMSSFILVTNHVNAVPIRMGNRRFVMYSCSDKYASIGGKDHPFWRDFYDVWYRPNREAILRALTEHYTYIYPSEHTPEEVTSILSVIPESKTARATMLCRLSCSDRILVKYYHEFVSGHVDTERLSEMLGTERGQNGLIAAAGMNKQKDSKFKTEIIARCRIGADGRISNCKVDGKVVRLYRLNERSIAELSGFYRDELDLFLVDSNDDAT